MEENLKRPKDVVYYNAENEQQQIYDDQPNTIQLISMISGVIAFLLKYRFSVWISLTFFLANYLDQKMGVPQGKYLMNFGLIILAFLLIYVIPS